ncbi:MAG TPA: SDR family oxidoreductase, partial [Chloroflexota bacterium]|nr:SDR family oxidoreductase [Chloroflexota bacterium]
MTMRLQGKTALITGGTAGIGRAIAQAFTREGARVVIAGRDTERGHAAAAAIGGRATYIEADMSLMADVRGLARAATEALGQVDILVNNAGIGVFSPTAELAEADYDALFATNTKGTYFLTAALAPAMAERGTGRVINITTMVAHFGMSGFAAYGASKAAIDLLTKAWAAEYGPSGVNVNAIAPGPVRTERSGPGLDQMASAAPAGRPGRPEEIAAAAVYLASEEAAFV